MDRTLIVLENRYKRVSIEVPYNELTLEELFNDLITPAVKGLGYYGVEKYFNIGDD